jgi:hypothetical protein
MELERKELLLRCAHGKGGLVASTHPIGAACLVPGDGRACEPTAERGVPACSFVCSRLFLEFWRGGFLPFQKVQRRRAVEFRKVGILT